ncbi:MAG: dinitrogenase iron-molybdenum cofactor biosynthesis protein [Deltaproteobacteria bacterium]|jgi:predicted Fe-Mo cluster-binding NifX family protein|nr:dinitrogenase iron-molybdenum cofactor biosynthesis protein [Deltaproteobacteria bacterium]
MKAALTIWEGRISPVFDVSREALILTVENGVVTSRHSESIEAPAPAAKIERLLTLGIATLVCGAISAPLQHALSVRGVKVIAFVAGEIDEVVAGFLAGRLPTEALSMPGCCRERKRFRGRRDREGGGGGGRRRGRR